MNHKDMFPTVMALASSAGWRPNKARDLSERDKNLRSPELVAELKRKAAEKQARKAKRK